MLYGHLLLDSSSFGLYDLFNLHGEEFGVAGGEAFHLLTIGDSVQSDRHFVAAHPELAPKLEVWGQTYVERVFKAGREKTHVLREMAETAESLGVLPSRPSIAMRRPGGTRALGLLRIARPWWEKPGAWQHFARSLQVWFSSSKFQQICNADLGDAALARLLEEQATEFSDKVRSIGGGTEREWRCSKCRKLLGRSRGGRLEILHSGGHHYFVTLPASATCENCNTLNELSEERGGS